MRIIVDARAGVVVNGVVRDGVEAAVQVDAVGLFRAVGGQVAVDDVAGERWRNRCRRRGKCRNVTLPKMVQLLTVRPVLFAVLEP